MIIYLCNAIDDVTKISRAITTDSPAATNKVFSLCRALQNAGSEVSVLSMGRGRQDGSGELFPAFIRNHLGLHIYYAAFSKSPFLTHFITVCSLVGQFIKIRKERKTKLIVYNRFWHYLPVLCVARLHGVHCYLDLEDGFTESIKLPVKLLIMLFDAICEHKALVACNALKAYVHADTTFVCYGIAANNFYPKKWDVEKIQILLGGSLCVDTGAQLFIDALRLLTVNNPELVDRLQFIITGKGDMAETLSLFSEGEAINWVEFRGEVSSADYNNLLNESHVGLCLKLPSGVFHNTTFPSKVIDIVSNGLLLVTTTVSDVPNILSKNDAILLDNESPEALSKALVWVADNRDKLAEIAECGKKKVMRICSAERVGSDLKEFLT